MGLKTYATLAGAEADGCFRASVLAAKIGVDRRQVWTWTSRRDRNGFPGPCGNANGIDVFDYEAVVRWRARYIPSKGGAPKKVLTGATVVG